MVSLHCLPSFFFAKSVAVGSANGEGFRSRQSSKSIMSTLPSDCLNQCRLDTSR